MEISLKKARSPGTTEGQIRLGTRVVDLKCRVQVHNLGIHVEGFRARGSGVRSQAARSCVLIKCLKGSSGQRISFSRPLRMGIWSEEPPIK
jgi:hypothetical protein